MAAPTVTVLSTAAPSTAASSTTAAASSTSPTSISSTTPPATTTASSATPSSPSSSAATTSASSSSSSAQSSSSSPSPVVSQTVFSSAGNVQTITQVITPIATSTGAPQSNSSSSNSFFSNTKAVIGVFTAVGVVVLALVIALVINAIRRRRAQKFDRDVAEAAAEAAASSRSPFEDYSYANTGGNSGGGGGGGGSGGGYGYSENSHGTYQSPALQPNDTYGMSEMSQYDPYAVAAAAAVDRSRNRKESEPGTPGIAGVGARGLAREPSKRAPYHAFAGPGPQLNELQTSNGTIRNQRGTNLDVLEAAGLAASAGTSTIAGNNGNVTRRPSETTQNTHFSGRSQFGSLSTHHPTPLQPGYPVESYYPQRHDSLSPDPFAVGYPPVMSVSTAFPNPHDATLPSPSLPGHQSSDHNEDYNELGSSTALHGEEQRMSYQDDTDYSHGNRILRVANE